ncbi:tetratricopeptide repeat protein [Sporosarcina sp. HYO08]|uniref:tetratricopeptide repeat protein n=1 Tax=Sporosarcina sp. HYO08 TaxID=1759557 RepID=UPI00079A5312|nr:tetratricopeptide repeat protein [Sporosarcina sp. HYO08]KXH87288.1 hypothetical protein AU377_01565 [Sporosarcina sp. HYO08]
MRRKYQRLRKNGNVIVFPGTFERLVQKGLQAVERSKFEEAIEAFDQAIVYEPEDVSFLGPYAVALYETKDFERAKEIAGKLLLSGTANYIDAMELYLTISIQLQEYEEVELTIGALLDEKVIPEDMLNKFQYLRELNSRLSRRYVSEEWIQNEMFTLNDFLNMNTSTQQHVLASLEGSDLTAMLPTLVQIAGQEDISPAVITFALTLLQQEGYDGEVTVHKFGMEKTIVPAQLDFPGKDPQTDKVMDVLDETLIKDPTRLEMARALIEKFTITMYPFGWGDYEAEEIAAAYENYIECLLLGFEFPVTELNQLIHRIDAIPDE